MKDLDGRDGGLKGMARMEFIRDVWLRSLSHLSHATPLQIAKR